MEGFLQAVGVFSLIIFGVVLVFSFIEYLCESRAVLLEHEQLKNDVKNLELDFDNVNRYTQILNQEIERLKNTKKDKSKKELDKLLNR